MPKRTPRGSVVSIKPQINPEVVIMMTARHEAHRRGNYVVLGSVSLLQTAHGVLRFPVAGGVATGPTIGYVTDSESKPNPQQLVVLTSWEGVPDLREKTDKFCTACLADCDNCGATGKKICEGVGCGGSGWTPGPFEQCGAPGCAKDAGKFNPSCEVCHGSGQIVPHLECLMCKGTGKMICPVCKGETRYATGIKGGAKDWTLGKCETCHGEQRQAFVKPQPIEAFINAVFPDPKNGPIIAVGPITSYIVDLTQEMREQENTVVKIFDVKEDAAGDHLFLLIDTASNPPWPYLVGGLLLERRPGVLQTTGEAVLPR